MSEERCWRRLSACACVVCVPAGWAEGPVLPSVAVISFGGRQGCGRGVNRVRMSKGKGGAPSAFIPPQQAHSTAVIAGHLAQIRESQTWQHTKWGHQCT